MQREREQFLDYVRRHGMRVTPERLALFEAIYAHHEHIDADALLDALKSQGVKISRATVYRNLELLVECGLVRKQRLGHDRFLYEHVHPGQRHDHLVCRECGRVVEFVSPGIAALQAEICRAHGFDPGQFSLQIHSLCNGCSATETAMEAATEAVAGGGRPGEPDKTAETDKTDKTAETDKTDKTDATRPPSRRRWLTDPFAP